MLNNSSPTLTANLLSNGQLTFCRKTDAYNVHCIVFIGIYNCKYNKQDLLRGEKKKTFVPYMYMNLRNYVFINNFMSFFFLIYSALICKIQFRVNTISMSKTVLFQIIQFIISTQFKCKYGLIVKTISILSYSI